MYVYTTSLYLRMYFMKNNLVSAKATQLPMQLIILYVKYVADTLEQKKHVIRIFLDLSKAFDTICHSKLSVKLQNYGIRGNCFELIKNY